MKLLNLIFLVFITLFLGCKKGNDNIIEERINLVNTRWAINESKEIPLSKNKNSQVPIIWLGENSFGIATDCNGIAGLLKISEKSLTFTDYQSTLKHCEGTGAMEMYLMQNLIKIDSYKYSNGILYLYIGTKMIGSFKRIE